jgi:hypothetical protein
MMASDSSIAVIFVAESGERPVCPRIPRIPISYVSMDLSVMTVSSSHMRHDDMFLQEHLAHRVNTYE